MASKNQLLSPGKLIEEKLESAIVELEETDFGKRPKIPAWRFHKNCIEGKLCKTEPDLAKCKDEDGWKDHPGKIKKLPGHEDLYTGEEYEEEDDD